MCSLIVGLMVGNSERWVWRLQYVYIADAAYKVRVQEQDLETAMATGKEAGCFAAG